MSKPCRFISHVANGPWGKKKHHEYSLRKKEVRINLYADSAFVCRHDGNRRTLTDEKETEKDVT